jgi:hypothetical protein
MDLKDILLKRLKEETTYEDAYGLKEITEVIEEVFKEAEANQLLTHDVVGRFYTEAEIKEIKEIEYRKGLLFEGY